MEPEQSDANPTEPDGPHVFIDITAALAGAASIQVLHHGAGAGPGPLTSNRYQPDVARRIAAELDVAARTGDDLFALRPIGPPPE